MLIQQLPKALINTAYGDGLSQNAGLKLMHAWYAWSFLNYKNNLKLCSSIVYVLQQGKVCVLNGERPILTCTMTSRKKVL